MKSAERIFDFSQDIAIANGLDLKDVLILQTLADMTPGDHKGKYLFTYDSIVEYLPILGLTKNALRKRMYELKAKSIITIDCLRNEDGTRCYVGFDNIFHKMYRRVKQ